MRHRQPPPECCTCCDNAARARATLAAVLERGDDPDHWWCSEPENVCHCPSQPPAQRCTCRYCLSWLRRAPRCARDDCWLYARGDAGLCRDHAAGVREQRRVAAAKAREIRKPPRPPHQHEPGCCSLCGTSPLPPRRRSWCSDACVELWNIATSGQAAYAHLVDLHGFVCWGCGDHGMRERGGDPMLLEVEHMRPLWSLTPAERQQLRWWLPYNLQLLCTTCHKAKSAREASERAALRRAT